MVPMPVRSCKVTIEDMNGVSHTVEVTAETLCEAVALGMAAIRTVGLWKTVKFNWRSVDAKPNWFTKS